MGANKSRTRANPGERRKPSGKKKQPARETSGGKTNWSKSEKELDKKLGQDAKGVNGDQQDRG